MQFKHQCKIEKSPLYLTSLVYIYILRFTQLQLDKADFTL